MAKDKITACYLFSKAKHTETIKYAGKDVILPPLATKFKIDDESKLGDLPNTVRKIIIQEDK